jgi:hypothetical protein
VGVYEIVIKLFTGISATVKVWVVTAEGAAAGEAAGTRA